MKHENKLLTITISLFLLYVCCFVFLISTAMSDSNYNSIPIVFNTMNIILFISGMICILPIIWLILSTAKNFRKKKGLHIRHEGKLQAISLKTWDIGGNKVSLHTLDLTISDVLDFSKVKGDISTIQALKIRYNLPIGLIPERLMFKLVENFQLLRSLKVLDINTGVYGMNVKIEDLKELTELEVLILNLKTLAKIPNLGIFPKLKVLNLSQNKIGKIEGLVKLKNLKVLDLSYNEITQIREIESLEKLEALSLHHNQISEIEGLTNLKELKRLNLSNNKITEIKNVESLANLKILDLNFNKINKVKGLSGLKKLLRLSLDNNPVYDKRGSFFEGMIIFKTPQEVVAYCSKNEKAQEKATEYIKKLPAIYDDITFRELESKTSLDINILKPIIEELIFSKQIKAKITGDSIFFGKEKIVSTSSPVHKKIPQISRQNISIKKIKSDHQLKVFLSYSTLDSPYFHISDIAKALNRYPEINKILFWEADSSENIVEYMERTLQDCNVFVLFCSENAFNSQAVTDEWQAAFQLRKKGQLKIVPVYEDEKHIPALLTPLLNVKFSKEDQIEFIIKLYQEILRE